MPCAIRAVAQGFLPCPEGLFARVAQSALRFCPQKKDAALFFWSFCDKRYGFCCKTENDML